MSYRRVLPRDAFNEANYLKCIGQLALLIHDNINNERQYYSLITDLYEEFGSCLDQNGDGDLYCKFTRIYINHAAYKIFRPLNSREAFPVFITTDVGSIELLNDEGQLNQDFIDWCNA
jgi:hypothetical protein